MSSDLKRGLRDGIPICLGYFAVSFAFGILAVEGGCTIFESVLISLTNLTSAGQFAGLTVIVQAGTLVEMAVTQLVINARYMLMSIALSQKVDSGFRGIWRWILGFGITDEIFPERGPGDKGVFWRPDVSAGHRMDCRYILRGFSGKHSAGNPDQCSGRGPLRHVYRRGGAEVSGR